MAKLPITVENASGEVIAKLSESLLRTAIELTETLKTGATIKRNGEFIYSRGV